MAARFPLVIVLLPTWIACGANPETQSSESPQRVESYARPSPSEPSPAVVVPQNPADRHIRRELTLAIAHDAELKDREISFIVSNGDVSVTGIVRTESERERINDLAMGIPGVNSVANALRVSP